MTSMGSLRGLHIWHAFLPTGLGYIPCSAANLAAFDLTSLPLAYI